MCSDQVVQICGMGPVKVYGIRHDAILSFAKSANRSKNDINGLNIRFCRKSCHSWNSQGTTRLVLDEASGPNFITSSFINEVYVSKNFRSSDLPLFQMPFDHSPDY